MGKMVNLNGKVPEEHARSEQQRRLFFIRQLMKERRVKNNPRDYVIINQATQIMDVSGVYTIKAELPNPIETGNHVWVRGYHNGREIMAAAIVVEDQGETVLVRDEPRTKEWPIPRSELSSLPLTMAPMLIHKTKLDDYLGEGWAEVFWDFKLHRRRIKPKARNIVRLKR